MGYKPCEKAPDCLCEGCKETKAYIHSLEKKIELLQGDLPPKSPEEKIPFQEIIDTLNSLTGRQFKCVPAYKAHIRARWNEGFREGDFEKVVRIKKSQWGDDPQMKLYLRPETLFSPKFNSYINEPEPPRKKMIMNHMGEMIEVDE